MSVGRLRHTIAPAINGSGDQPCNNGECANVSPWHKGGLTAHTSIASLSSSKALLPMPFRRCTTSVVFKHTGILVVLCDGMQENKTTSTTALWCVCVCVCLCFFFFFFLLERLCKHASFIAPCRVTLMWHVAFLKLPRPRQ